MKFSFNRVSARAKGGLGEDLAADFLHEHGFKILQRNYAIKDNFQGGEIDIIAKRGETIHFIEVKSRNSDKFGLGREAIGAQKQRTIRKLAVHYLVAHKLYEAVPVSLDVIEITAGKIEHIENCL